MSQALLGRKASSAFTGRPLVQGKRLHNVAIRPQRQPAMAVRAMIREFPDPEFIAETLAAFPDKGIATVEEVRVLYDAGWSYVDVRPALEVDEVGKFKGAVNIPLMISKKVYNQEEQKKTYVKSENPDFLKLIQRKFPSKEAKIVIGCSDGRSYSLDALDALDEAGYVNIVGMRGGYYTWFRTFDNNLRRRRFGEYQETYNHDGDSCGIHASGAGFSMVDKIEGWVPPQY